MSNIDIRNLLKTHCIKHWELAEKLNISETTLVRKLRRELPTKEKEKLINIIKNFRKEG